MIRRDLPEVLNIETCSFDHTWGEEEFLLTLRQRDCIGMVAENNDKIVGFMIYQLSKKKIHILNFAVDSNCRRQGVGTQMINKLKSKLSPGRRNNIELEVEDSNLQAQLFYKKNGFIATEVLWGYYHASNNDGYSMVYSLDVVKPKEELKVYYEPEKMDG